MSGWHGSAQLTRADGHWSGFRKAEPRGPNPESGLIDVMRPRVLSPLRLCGGGRILAGARCGIPCLNPEP